VTLTVTNSAGTSTSKVFSSRFMSNNGGSTAVLSQLVGIAPPLPTNLEGFKTCFQGRCGMKISNCLRWSPPADDAPPAFYRIYRDAALTTLLALIPNGAPLRFIDKNRKAGKVYSYYIVAVSDSGAVSAPASITIKPNKCCR
jgi:hypothetical protein